MGGLCGVFEMIIAAHSAGAYFLSSHLKEFTGIAPLN